MAVDAYAASIDAAHGGDAWRTHHAVRATIRVSLGENEVIHGTMLYEYRTGRVRMELVDNTVLVFDGEHAWVSPAEAPGPIGARFHLLTWPYFLAAPFKLRDPGAHLELMGEIPLDDQKCQGGRLTFDFEVGDTPDDWFIIYQSAETGRIAAMAYIVTYATLPREARRDPHAIRYLDEIEVDGVWFARRWVFRHWSGSKGLHDEAMGEARLSDIEFVKPDEDAFVKPDDAREDVLPEVW